jgi:hypothetical protein
VLPVIALYGQGSSKQNAIDAVERGRRAYLDFVEKQQQSAAIAPNQRVDLKVLQRSTPPVVIQPRKKTLPIVVYIAGLSATIGLAFLLENLRPRAHDLPKLDEAAPPVEARRTA